jgi:HSP20 family protein
MGSDSTSPDASPVRVSRADRNVREPMQTPPVDLYETGTGWVLLADVPGVGKDDVEVEVDRGVLTVRAAMSSEQPTGRPVLEEFARADYFRTVVLSDEVDWERISANVHDGVLTVTMPKAEQARPRRIRVEPG